MTITANPKSMAAVFGVTLILAGVLAWLSSRPTLVGRHAYQYVTALHSICHQEDPQRLKFFTEQLQKAKDSDQLTGREFDIIQSIVNRAAAGKWEAARSHSRQLLEDQVDKRTGR